MFHKDLLTLSGWGYKNNKNEVSDNLLSATFTIADIQMCRDKLFVPTLENSQHICAQSSKNQDSCEGDSGGLLNKLH